MRLETGQFSKDSDYCTEEMSRRNKQTLANKTSINKECQSQLRKEMTDTLASVRIISTLNAIKYLERGKK
jgi:hypothetical protein